jgi:excisionase family DNA binding protein
MDGADGRVRIGEVAADLGLSASRIRQLADSGAIPSARTSGGQRLFDLGEVRAALARRSLPLDPLTAAEEAKPSWHRDLTLLGLSEDVVWARIQDDLSLQDGPARRIMSFAFTEMLNNAIDHSGSETATIKWWVSPDQWSFEIRDYGVGAFTKLHTGLNLGSDFEAVQELSKGKRTTDRVNHSGQGIFFTSKAADVFRLTSAGIRWTVDNIRHDVALGAAVLVKGTSVECQVDPQTTRALPSIFGQFTDEDAAFVRTRPVVKLFEIGTTFVSRSEAKRLLEGLAADFDAVDVDFTAVTDVGQGFVDELLRVWPNSHPGKTVNPINMNPAVEFMVRRGLAQ